MSNSDAVFIRPRDSGGGGPHEVRWRGRLTQHARPRRRTFITARAPSTMLRMVPLPRYRGGGCTIPFSRCIPHPSFCSGTNFSALRTDLRQRIPAVDAGRLTICALSHDYKNGRKQGSGTPRDAYPTSAPCGVRRAQSAARSPLGVPPRLLPEGRRSPRLSFRPGFLGRGFPGRYPVSPVPVQWQHPTHRS